MEQETAPDTSVKAICSHPFGEIHEATLKEPTEYNDKGWMPVCHEHVDHTKDGITSL